MHKLNLTLSEDARPELFFPGLFGQNKKKNSIRQTAKIPEIKFIQKSFE